MRIVCSLLALVTALALAPLLPGIIARVKAKVAGRRGRPYLQLYYDLAKLVRKSPVYPEPATWMFSLGPVISCSASIIALALIPARGIPGVISFSGDIFLLAGMLALSRLALMMPALETGSAFEGMGTAREAFFSALVEPVFLLFLALFAFQMDSLSLSGIIGGVTITVWSVQWPFFLLLAIAVYLLMLTENSRIPVDDPTTHLELTMIHEVMLLDHSGPELALYEYASSLKMWAFGLILAGLVLPLANEPLFTETGDIVSGGVALVGLNFCLTLLCVAGMTVMTGITESFMARLRLERVPHLVAFAGALVMFAGLLVWRS